MKEQLTYEKKGDKVVVKIMGKRKGTYKEEIYLSNLNYKDYKQLSYLLKDLETWGADIDKAYKYMRKSKDVFW